MRDLAKKLKESTKSGPENAKLYHEAALTLASMKDPDLIAAFFEELGPQSIELLVATMSGSGSKTTREDVKAFSTALGTAFKDTDPSQGLRDVMNMFANPRRRTAFSSRRPPGAGSRCSRTATSTPPGWPKSSAPTAWTPSPARTAAASAASPVAP